jgi:hypothetical protein
MAKGILINARSYARMAQDEYDDWYETEHLPQRLGVPGFLQCGRWQGVAEAKVSLAAYELEGVDVLASAAYRAVGYDNNSPWTKRIVAHCTRIVRFEGEQVDPGDDLAPLAACGLLLVGLNLQHEGDAAAQRWFANDWLPRVRSIAGVARARLYRASAPSDRTFVVLVHLDAPEVARSAAWVAAGGDDLPPGANDALRVLCRPYVRGG